MSHNICSAMDITSYSSNIYTRYIWWCVQFGMTLEIPSEPAEWNFYTIKNLWNVYHVQVHALPLYQIHVITLKYNQTVHCAIMVYQSGWWAIYHTQYNEIERRVFELIHWPSAHRTHRLKQICVTTQLHQNIVRGKKSLQLFTNFAYNYGINAPTMLEATNVSFRFSNRLQITLKENATKLAVKCSAGMNFLNHRNGKV